VKQLAEFIQIHDSVAEMKGKADKLLGLDRAKMLDEIVMGYEKLGVENEDAATYGPEIIALDTANAAGLKLKYTLRGLMAEAKRLKNQAKFADAQTVCERALALSGLSGQQKQDVYYNQGEIYFMEKDFPGLLACLRKSLDAAPDSSKAADIKRVIERFTRMAEAAAEKKKAAGAETAKSPDRRDEAAAKLGTPLSLPEIAKRSKAIVALSPGNKDGVKTRNMLRALLAQAAIHLKAKNVEKAQADLDKALAVPGLTDAQKTAIEQLAKGLKNQGPTGEGNGQASARAK
jgi:tetratricopeptide (TPR) repeat protein